MSISHGSIAVNLDMNSSASIHNPDDHKTIIRVQLLVRIASTASEEDIKTADDLRHQWQKNLVIDAKSDTGTSRKKKIEKLGPTLSPDQAYHVEFTLPSDDGTDRPPDRQSAKFFLDIINLQYMAKVYFGCKSDALRYIDMFVKNAIDDSTAKLFRYFRRNEHTYCYMEVEFDWTVTDSVIRRLATHAIEVQIFESPEKLSPRAKTDFRMPKKISLPHFAELMFSTKQSKDWANDFSVKEHTEAQKSEWIADCLTEQYLSGKAAWSRSSLTSVFPPAPRSSLTPPELPATPILPLPTAASGQATLIARTKVHAANSKKILNQKAKQELLAAKLARRNLEAVKTPVVTFRSSLSTLFLPGNAVTMRSISSAKIGPTDDENTELLSTIYDGFFRLAVKDGDLFSLGQRIHLNPLTISIEAVESLPAKPVDFTTLDKLCHPFYVEFNRFGLEKFRTTAQPAAANLQWNEPVVTFMNQMDPELLKELLVGPPWEIQVHDRDRKDGTCDNTYGVAKLDLYPLFVHNLKEMDYEIPVLPYISHRCNLVVEKPDPIDIQKVPDPHVLAPQNAPKDPKEMKKAAAAKKAAEKVSAAGASVVGKLLHGRGQKGASSPRLPPVSPLPYGRYQDSKTMLKLHVSVAFPLKNFVKASPPTGSAPFCRYILVLPANESSKELLHAIHMFTDDLNSKTLSLTEDQQVCFAMQNHLMTFPFHLSEIAPEETDDSEDPDFVPPKPIDFNKSDVITGFHLHDGEVHVAVLEGLHEKGMRNFAELVSKNLHALNVADSVFLWDSTMRFSKRLYGGFGACLFRVQLIRTLRKVAADPYLKMSKFFPLDVTFTVKQLHQMAYCTKQPRDLSKHQLFPSVDSLRTFQAHLGTMHEYEDRYR